MKASVKPLVTFDAGGTAVRLFASPAWTEKGIPDMPWHAVDDLWPAVLGHASFDLALRSLRRDWNGPRTVAVDGSILTMAPRFMAEGLIEAVIEAAGAREKERLLKLRGAFRRACAEGLKAMAAGRDPMGKLAFSLAAMSYDCEGPEGA